MPVFFLYFLAAGAATIGGPAIGGVLYKRGQQSASAHLRQHDIAEISRLLRSEMGLAQLRREAQHAGVDFGLVEKGYYALRDDQITLEQIAAKFEQWSSQ